MDVLPILCALCHSWTCAPTQKISQPNAVVYVREPPQQVLCAVHCRPWGQCGTGRARRGICGLTSCLKILRKAGTISAHRLSNLIAGVEIAVATGDGGAVWQFLLGRSITSSRRRPSSSSKRSRACRAAAWQPRSGRVRGTWRSSPSKPRGHTASWRVTSTVRFSVSAIRRSSRTKKTTNSRPGAVDRARPFSPLSKRNEKTCARSKDLHCVQ